MPYVYAGSETLFSLIENRFDKLYKNKIKFLLPYCRKITNKFLVTYGTSLNRKNNIKLKKRGEYTKTILKNFFQKDFAKFPLFLVSKKELELFIDSGGFQATMGFLSDDEIPLFIEEYYYFLKNYHHFFTKAFSLDLLLLEGKYRTQKEMLYINQKSFSKLAELPQEIRNKILFIYHFRTKELYYTWLKISKEFENVFSDYYAAGGIVATHDNDSPILSYTIPIVFTVNAAKKRKLKKVKLHFLGGSSYTDVFLYSLFKKIVKQYHDIDLEITYDSSAAFKQIEVARQIVIPYFDEEGMHLYDISLREKDVNKFQLKHKGILKSSKEILDIEIQNFIKEMNLPSIFFDNYQKISYYENNKFNQYKSFYFKVYLGYLYKKIEEYSENIMKKINLEDITQDILFSNEINDKITSYIKMLNRDKYTKNLRKKINLTKTIETIKNLDFEYIDFIVNQYFYNL